MFFSTQPHLGNHVFFVFFRSILLGLALLTNGTFGFPIHVLAQTPVYDATLPTDSPVFFEAQATKKQAPSLLLSTPRGPQTLQALLAAQAKGQQALVLFWSPTCKLCVDELADMAARLQMAQPPVLIPIAVQEKGAVVLPLFLKRHGVTLPLQWVEGLEDLHAFPIRGFPTGFLLTPQGKILARREGAHVWQTRP